MQKKTVVVAIVLLLGMAGAASASVAQLRTKVSPLTGCNSPCTSDTDCLNAGRCSACTPAPLGTFCESVK